ncbi:D-alanyl-D-alanine carboxypeptidase family protein [Thermohalobacter berrensis]|uniref:serine-type D-Ala-D-Ala carboxypeptidase n=1 Tax=Thermohalobacter berrensis TaxID=99594 RepID=A0A419TAN7_9FIRM|nr:D-alanyl-D-alanine carboxypeptidase family protein [Thermohalobacter berrensis]RKD34546.1 D-alanyl-D-alanine carboxypeptidase [Thermohalobacter berrensis]
MKRKLVSVCISLLLLLNSMGFIYAETSFDVKAKSAILIDASTGKVIYEKNPHKKLAPASITKIMVLLLAMEALENNKISLEDEVVVSRNASGMGGSQIYLEEGEVQKVEHLIRAIALRSANDAAVALGEHIAGSEELFVKMMNEKAKELGMLNTHFMNPTGLDDESHYTSAYDVSLMSRELLKYPKIHNWLTLWMSKVKVGKEKDIEQVLVNTNRLIHDYKGANGIKTGSTSKAGFCLSASATRGNLTLISVVMGCDSSSIRFMESKKLLDYGFANYTSIPILKKGQLVKRLPVNKGKANNVNIISKEDFSLLVKKGKGKKVEKKIVLPEYINAPINKGQKVGEMILMLDGKEVNRVDLISKEKVEKASLVDMLLKIVNKILGD